MTEEELEKEAEENLVKQLGFDKGFIEQEVSKIKNPNNKFSVDALIREVRFAYIAGAEPREKQIEIDAKQIIALQKDKGNLTDRVKELEAELSKLKPYRCKNHYAVSEKETSNAVLCYRVQNCESCGHFKE